MTDSDIESDTESISELDWAEWSELQNYLESSERTFESAIQTMEHLLHQTNEMEEMIEKLHLASLQDLEEMGECTFGDRIVEWIQKIDPSVKEEEAECSNASSDDKENSGDEETAITSPR